MKKPEGIGSRKQRKRERDRSDPGKEWHARRRDEFVGRWNKAETERLDGEKRRKVNRVLKDRRIAPRAR